MKLDFTAFPLTRELIKVGSLSHSMDRKDHHLLEPVPCPVALNPDAPLWARGWTALDFHGYRGSDTCQAPPWPCSMLAGAGCNGGGSDTNSRFIMMINTVFKGGPAPLPCEAVVIVSCSGAVTSADIVSNVVFKGGSSPCAICASGPLARDSYP